MTENRLLEQVRLAARRDTLHHALLLTGGQSEETALYIAAAFQCTDKEHRPCRTCQDCRKVFARIHPDVIVVRDDAHKTIPVDMMRGICADACIRPNEGERKVYIFPDCGQLDGRCQDILLKTIEDGPRFNAFIFLAESAAALLPTLRSRCIVPAWQASDTQGVSVSEEAEQWARRLMDCLCRRSEAEIAALLCSQEGKKLKRETAAEYVQAAATLCTAALLRRSGAARLSGDENPAPAVKHLTNREMMGIIEILQKTRGHLQRNGGVGHCFGGAAAELAQCVCGG